MVAKEVKFSVDARDSMLRGIDILAHAVRVTTLKLDVLVVFAAMAFVSAIVLGAF